MRIVLARWIIAGQLFLLLSGCCEAEKEPEPTKPRREKEAAPDTLHTDVHLSGELALVRSQAQPRSVRSAEEPSPTPAKRDEELLAEATEAAALARRGRTEAANAAQEAANAAVAAREAAEGLDEAGATAAASTAKDRAAKARDAAQSAEEGATRARTVQGALQPGSSGRTVRRVTDAAGAARSDADRAKASADAAEESAKRAEASALAAARGAAQKRALAEAAGRDGRKAAEAEEALERAGAALAEASDAMDAGDADGTERGLNAASEAVGVAEGASSAALAETEAAARRLTEIEGGLDGGGGGTEVRSALEKESAAAAKRIASGRSRAQGAVVRTREVRARVEALRRELSGRIATGMHPTMPVVVPPPEERAPVGVRQPAAAPPQVRVVGAWRQVGGVTSADAFPGNYSTNELLLRADGVAEIRRSFGEGAMTVTWRVSYRWNVETNTLELGQDPALRPPAATLEPISVDGVNSTKPSKELPVTSTVVPMADGRLEIDGRTFERVPALR